MPVSNLLRGVGAPRGLRVVTYVPPLQAHPEVWLVTGTGRHVAARGHQKTAEGGVLRAAVEEYLQVRSKYVDRNR